MLWVIEGVNHSVGLNQSTDRCPVLLQPYWMKSREYWDSNFEERYKVRKTKWPKLPLKVSPDQGLQPLLRWAGSQGTWHLGHHCSWPAVVCSPQYISDVIL